MKACIEKKTIEMSKNEAKAAGKINSEKFKELQDYRAAYPGYEIVIVAAAKRKNDLGELNYDFMKTYIKAHDDAQKTAMAEFNILTAQAKKDGEENSAYLEAASYFEVKKWFLKKFPEIAEFKENHQKRIAEILAAAA